MLHLFKQPAILTILTFLMSTPMALAVQIVGHRGASYDAPENTVASFRLGMQQGADAIETDLWLTKDHQIILSHDADTTRTTGVEMKIPESSFDELRKLDAGKWKGPQWAWQKLPTVQEVLGCVLPGKRVLLEIKCGPEIVPVLKPMLEASSLKREQIVIISFHDDVIAEVKKQMPDLKAYWLFNYKQDKDGKWNAGEEEVLSTLKRIGADGLDIQLSKAMQEKVNAELGKKLKAMGQEFHVWTVDDPELAKYAVKIGVDSITTNRPGFVREQLGLGK